MRFLTTRQISGEIERIIREANEYITIVSPYVRIAKTYVDRIAERSAQGLQVNIVFGKEDMNPNEEQRLSQIPGLQLYFLDNLHAKCYMNERDVVITSMNLYEYSENNNREMGLSFERSENERMFTDIKNEVGSFINNAVPHTNTTQFHAPDPRTDAANEPGYCIRCGRDIQFDPGRPMCRDCYTAWAEFSNFEYPENVCHSCGSRARISMSRPLCYDCFRYLK